MSWEVVREETKPCWCGGGTITYVLEMDDWNRTQSYRNIACPICKAKAEKEAQETQRKEALRERLLEEAKSLAKERYMNKWLARFNGLNKKETWFLLTGGSEYPALGTFYKHVKDEGMEKYLGRNFIQDVPKALAQMGVKDKDVEKLLSERNAV